MKALGRQASRQEAGRHKVKETRSNRQGGRHKVGRQAGKQEEKETDRVGQKNIAEESECHKTLQEICWN